MPVTLPDITKAFKLFDENGDGKITMDELKQAMIKLGQNPTKLELKLLMKEADADNSGSISFEEFKTYMTSPPKGRFAREALEEQFRLFDIDGDGFITKEELAKITQELKLESSFSQDIIDQMFRDADDNGDGQISFDEYMKAML